MGVGVIVDTGLLVDLGVASVDVPLSAVGPSSGRRALGETRTVVQSVLYCVEMHDDDTPLRTCELAVDLRDYLGNVLPIADLEDPIRLAFEGTGTCVTWDGTTWVQDPNVATIRGVGTTICETTHLSSFALKDEVVCSAPPYLPLREGKDRGGLCLARVVKMRASSKFSAQFVARLLAAQASARACVRSMAWS